MENRVTHLFVYGSLRSGFHSPAYNYVSKYFTLAGAAKAKGLLLDMGDYPVAVATNNHQFIVGELYYITNKNAFDFAIAQLDDYEGINTEPDEVQLYVRTLTDVEIEGKTITAWVYWYNGDVMGKSIVESGDVLQYMEAKKNK